MSSFVTSDHTVLAITEGMRRNGLIYEDDQRFMIDSLRFVNEKQTARRYSENPVHDAVKCKPRPYENLEILAACNCWLYQVETGNPMNIDEITIYEAVKMLRGKIIDMCEADGSLGVERSSGGGCEYLVMDGDRSIGSLHGIYGWDLGDELKTVA